MHHRRWQRNGDPLRLVVDRVPPGLTPQQRLAAKSERRGECLIYAPNWKSADHRKLILASGRWVGAHVLAWELANERSVPSGLFVCHKCDTPPCIEPAHLFLGTPRDNNEDRDRKGRKVIVRGTKSSRWKLTEHQVQQVRTAILAGEQARDLAIRFGVHPETITGAAVGRRWSHVTDPPPLVFVGRGRHGRWAVADP
ncbi:HNH endonuclease [Pseudonocardia broussonetiae]|uniref:HNH nuclease domain-containing protein n=1 Tax=Pseudonocardia broussonetiae TaxID=2736640 RepID=A0A6M6JHZ3_9PSEU|nr:HNH endonuclease [Pseudonocardia broussonetiae]QJY46670.1 hypothetical protein HOP40_13275 [Pseudonocardia broussonetiae]